MPYIKQERRIILQPNYAMPETAGELNFQLTSLIKGYLFGHGLSYQTLNDISGAMTEALAEFRRMVIIPYENERMAENGVVY